MSVMILFFYLLMDNLIFDLYLVDDLHLYLTLILLDFLNLGNIVVGCLGMIHGRFLMRGIECCWL